MANSQTPNPKRQRNPKLQIPNGASIPRYWSLELGASLGFGFWDLEFSFVSQRLHRIDLRRATGGKQTGHASNRAESQRHGAKDPRVRGSNAKQQALDVVPRGDGQDNAEDQPVHNQPNSVSE